MNTELDQKLQKSKAIFNMLKEILIDKAENEEDIETLDNLLETELSKKISFELMKLTRQRLEEEGVNSTEFLSQFANLSVETEEDTEIYIDVIMKKLENLGFTLDNDAVTTAVIQSYSAISQVIMDELAEKYPQEATEVHQALVDSMPVLDNLVIKSE